MKHFTPGPRCRCATPPKAFPFGEGGPPQAGRMRSPSGQTSPGAAPRPGKCNYVRSNSQSSKRSSSCHPSRFRICRGGSREALQGWPPARCSGPRDVSRASPRRRAINPRVEPFPSRQPRPLREPPERGACAVCACSVRKTPLCNPGVGAGKDVNPRQHIVVPGKHQCDWAAGYMSSMASSSDICRSVCRHSTPI